ncbi:MAG: hypothetical protein AAGI52_10825 [Bacteroidota bacterium]
MTDSRPIAATREHRADVLRHFGAAEADLDALLNYTQNPFDLSGPLQKGDEPFVEVWEEYLAEAETVGVFPVLQRVLLQLRFPIREGIGETEAYRAATRRGDLSSLGGLRESGLRLVAPERLRLELHPTPAGRIPVLTAPVREDFVSLVQALTRRNEPTPLPTSMGALMVSGYNNWDRVSRYRSEWESGEIMTGSWAQAFRELIPQKHRYQDRFILLSEGPCGGIPASHFGLTDVEWIRRSHVIRREHEAAHYYCRRVLGAMRSNALDEWIADAAGVLAAGVPDPGFYLQAFLTDDEHGRLGSYADGLAGHQIGVVRRLLHSLIGRTDWDELHSLSLGQGPQAMARVIQRLASATLEEQWAQCAEEAIGVAG